MRLIMPAVVILFIPAFASATCPKKIPTQLSALAKQGLELNYADDYKCGMDFVFNIQDALTDVEAKPKGSKERKAAFREFIDASLAVAPYDQESQNASSAADDVSGDESLRPVLNDAIVQFQTTYDAKNLKQWCKAEVFRQVEASFECTKGKKKKECKEPTISYTACAHLTDAGRPEN